MAHIQLEILHLTLSINPLQTPHPHTHTHTLQSPCVMIKAFESSFLGLQLHLHSLSSPPSLSYRRCNVTGADHNRSPDLCRGRRTWRVNAKGKAKENVWSIDNEAAEGREERNKRWRRKRLPKRRLDGKVLISGAMLMEVETVLQTQEPVIRPAWNTFASSVSGIWKGVGAVFSPITAEMEPIDLGKKNENLFDCFTLLRIEAVPSADVGQISEIRRRVNWVTMNPHGENKLVNGRGNRSKHKSEDEYESLSTSEDRTLPKFESFDFEKSDIMEEDVMGMEPGLVFFEDGSYSRGPVEIPVGVADDTNYYLTPTLKFEQCLVKGCHKRLRIVHTIEFNDGRSDIQVMRVAVYEEQWVSTANLPDQSDVELDSNPFSERKRVQPSQLTGLWKVFEMSATPIYDDDDMSAEEEGKDSTTPYVYLCTETLKKRSLPENSFREEEALDMGDVTMMWLPGGMTGYVDVKKDGILCIGVGWYSDEGINLVMERDYGADGKLKDVRYSCEMKRRWSDEALPS